MPDYTVSGDVDSMLRSANDAAIRSAIGVGTTDAPTFLAQTLTGQSLTGTQATSLVDLAATWNTTGNPSLIYGRVTNTNSGASANLIDLGTFAGGSLFSVRKDGLVTAGLRFNIGTAGMWETGMSVGASLSYSWSSTSTYTSTADLILARDAPGILAQRNADAAQAFRIYNFYNTGGVNYERANFSWNSSRLEISTSGAGTGSSRKIDMGTYGATGITFFTNSLNRWAIGSDGHFIAATDNAYDIGASGANRPRNIYAGASIFCASDFNGERDIYCGIGRYFRFNVNGTTALSSSAAGVVTMADLGATNTTPRITLGGTTSAFPAIKRSTTSLQARLADDSAFTNIQGKLTTDTAYTATVVTPTGFLTLYDSTGTAYRVPCVV